MEGFDSTRAIPLGCCMAGFGVLLLPLVVAVSSCEPSEADTYEEEEDDFEDENQIIYTGEGGRDPNTGKQIENQILFASLFLENSPMWIDPLHASRRFNIRRQRAP